MNDHRAVLNVAQYDWPQQTLENPDSSPLLARAACIRGYLDTNEYLMDKLLREDLEVLEKLNEFLNSKLGPKWWVGTPLERFAPKQQGQLPDNPNPTNNLPSEDAKSDNDVSVRNSDEKLAA